MSHAPTVSIIGRPNVGKSTLFNRLLGKRQAIVHDQPGVTRDRLFSLVTTDDLCFELIDTGGLVPGDDPLGLGEQVMMAIDESDVLILVVDGKQGLVAADERVWGEVRKRGKTTLLAVNKGDTKAALENFDEFYRLGVERQILISAEHGVGTGELFTLLAEYLPSKDETLAPRDPEIPAIAVVGRPNVGKSSIVNRLLGQPRVLVSPVAGTTRDPIDTMLTYEGRTYCLVDTAGIRRRSQVSGAAEDIAVMFARRQMERADLAVLLIDASQGVTSGDMAIAGTAWEMGRAVVVAFNKWDLLDEELREDLEMSWERLQELLANPARVNVSALSSRRMDRLLPAVDKALERYRTELGTSEVNRFFEQALINHTPPQRKGKPWKLYYATQVSTGPPTFMLFANRTLERSDTYRRYLENRLREAYDLAGVPVRLVIRQRGG